jgi:hypothetical protein
MFKHNFDIQETFRRSRRLFDGKLTYRKLFIACVISCLFFLWILTRFFFGGGERVNIKGILIAKFNLNEFFFSTLNIFCRFIQFMY